MIHSPGLLLTVLAFACVIGPLVFIHEMGHYWVGRWFGIKAETFSIGFGRELVGWTDRRGTRWKLGWLPLGGYVRFAGDMTAASEPTAEWLSLPADERNRTFQAKPVWQRALVVAAGPVVNFVAAAAILGGFALAFGEIRTPPVVASTLPGSPAAAAGLRPGDRIVALDGGSIDSFDAIARYVVLRAGEPVTITVAREGALLTLHGTIGTAVEGDRFGNQMRVGQLGVAGGEPKVVPVAWWQAPLVAVRRTGELIGFTATSLERVLLGKVPAKDLRGPIGIAQVSGQQLAVGWTSLVALIALVSINLGFINLLPVPMLDGGHLLFYAIEAVRRRPVGLAVQEWAYRGAIAVIVTLMVFFSVNDLGRLGVW